MKKTGLVGNIFKPKLWISLALLALLAFLLSQLWLALNKKSDVDQEITALKEEASKAEAQNSQFKKMIEYLESDQFAEEQAKLKLGLKKEGEQVAVITGLDATDTEATNTTATSSNLVASDLTGNWQRWLEYFLTGAN